MSISSLVSSINKNIDSITVVRGLKTFMSDEMAKFQFGIYTGKVDTLVGLPLSFNIAFATVLVPSISKLLAQNLKKRCSKNYKIFFACYNPNRSAMYFWNDSIC